MSQDEPGTAPAPERRARTRGIPRAGATLVALVLSVGICTALNLFVFAVLYDALMNGDQAGISENATQILSGWGGGIISIISAVVGGGVGYAAGHYAGKNQPAEGELS